MSRQLNFGLWKPTIRVENGAFDYRIESAFPVSFIARFQFGPSSSVFNHAAIIRLAAAAPALLVSTSGPLAAILRTPVDGDVIRSIQDMS
jgi:hypothetical protein